MKWWMIAGGIIGVTAIVWIIKSAIVSPPGKNYKSQGQEHVTAADVAKFSYNSNPPSSGPHLPAWVKPGIYSEPQSEGELIHSLEHGYVIISYNCGVHLQSNLNFQFPMSNVQFPKVFAHEEDGPDSVPQGGTTTGKASGSMELSTPSVATGSAITDTESCKTLIKDLEDLAKRKKLFKLIVVPRPQLDTTIALTAWTYVDKFDPDPIGVDAKRIESFIDYHRDHGPEQTME